MVERVFIIGGVVVLNYKEVYDQWLNSDYFDDKIKLELKNIGQNEEEIQDRFYKDLEFGTAGLRGKIGAGTNRMNKYIIKRTTQGLANYIIKKGEEYKNRGVAIAYDCRLFSKEFAKYTALVLAGNGIRSYLFEDLRPTPELSFAVKRLNTAMGIVITASHNPKDYNGYKVYGENGAQILTNAAESIMKEISKIENFNCINEIEETEAMEKGLLNIIGREIDDEYINKVKELSIRDSKDEIDKDIVVVYTPLNGAGNISVRRVLRERGFKNINVVKEQEMPDGTFPTIEYPNPEDVKAFEYSISLGKKVGADLLIATDPDCDRVATMIKNSDGEYLALNGNQTGALLIKYILEGMKEKGMLPHNGIVVKSIVTGDLGMAVAEKYGVKTFQCLTGFKNICGLGEKLEKEQNYKFLFGYEESIGYTTGRFVMDKDGVITSMLLCEAAAYYKKQGKTLIDILNDVYEEFGYYREFSTSIVLEGIEGSKRIGRMMEEYRKSYPNEMCGEKLIRYIDFKIGEEKNLVTEEISKVDIPISDVLKFTFQDGSWYALRPSGTEPKIKLYIYVKKGSFKVAEDALKGMSEHILNKLYSIK